jgi:hypothetical protein
MQVGARRYVGCETGTKAGTKGESERAHYEYQADRIQKKKDIYCMRTKPDYAAIEIQPSLASGI